MARTTPLGSQAMLKGPKTLVGNGKVRDVFLVEYEGKTVVVKTLRHMNTLRSAKKHLERHVVEVLSLDVVSEGTYMYIVFLEFLEERKTCVGEKT